MVRPESPAERLERLRAVVRAGGGRRARLALALALARERKRVMRSHREQ